MYLYGLTLYFVTFLVCYKFDAIASIIDLIYCSVFKYKHDYLECTVSQLLPILHSNAWQNATLQ